jgi:hypothetical protein
VRPRPIRSEISWATSPDKGDIGCRSLLSMNELKSI